MTAPSELAPTPVSSLVAQHGDGNGKAPSQVMVVCGVRLYREGLELRIAQAFHAARVSSASTADEATHQLTEASYAVVLIDMGVPDALGIARECARLAPSAKVVAFALEDAEPDIVACAEAGIAGYVTRDEPFEEMVATVESALRGELRCSPRTAASLFRRLATLSEERRDDADATDHLRLTRREREIAVLLGRDLSNKEIARSLSIGTATVKNHVHNILEKLRVHRRSDAVERLGRREERDGRRSSVGEAPPVSRLPSP